jgi:hypothetical protein
MLVLAYWSGQTDLALCSLYMAESECCTNPVYAAVIRTASKQLQLHDLNSETCQSTSTCSDGQSVRTSRTCSLCQAVSKCCTNPVPAAIAQQPADSSRAATEQFQPHIMQAFASTPIRMCWFSHRSCSLLHPSPLVGMLQNPSMQQPQQQPADSRIQKSLQLHSLSSVMCPCKLVCICLLVPVY